MGRGRRDEVKETHWRGHVEAQRASGLSVRKYCAGHELRESAFYQWKRTIHERDAEKAKGLASGGSAFAEVVVHEAAQSLASKDKHSICGDAALMVEFVCGARVRLDRGFDAETFARAVRVLLDAERC